MKQSLPEVERPRLACDVHLSPNMAWFDSAGFKEILGSTIANHGNCRRFEMSARIMHDVLETFSTKKTILLF